MLARSLKKPSIQHSLNRSFLVCFMSAAFAEVFTMMGAAQSPSTNRRIFRLNNMGYAQNRCFDNLVFDFVLIFVLKVEFTERLEKLVITSVTGQLMYITLHYSWQQLSFSQ